MDGQQEKEQQEQQEQQNSNAEAHDSAAEMAALKELLEETNKSIAAVKKARIRLSAAATGLGAITTRNAATTKIRAKT